MTSMLDILFNSDFNLLKNHPRSPLSCKSLNCERETPKKRNQQTQLNSFIIPGKHNSFDLLFDIEFVQPQTTVKVFLISKLGNILKTSSEISKVELIRNFFNQKQFYRPSINPLTGFVYFKIDFFVFGEKRSEFNKANKIEWTLKGIDMEKLFGSIKNLQICSQKLENKQYKSWYNEQQKYRFASVKSIARTIQKQNPFQGMFDKLKCVSGQLQQQTTFKILQFQSFFDTQKSNHLSVDLRRIRYQIKEVQKVHPHLSTFIKNKSRKSNFDPLFVNASTKSKINEQINSMIRSNLQTATMRITQKQYEKAQLKFEKVTPSTMQKRKQFFSHLIKNHEYDQIDKYFDQSFNAPIQISLDTRCQNIQKYLEKNGNVISLQTKMRILVQIYTFIHTLWQENEIIFLMDLSKVFLTKKLCVKMRGLENFFKSDKEMIWQELDLINRKRSQSILNMSNLFFKLFYNRNLLFTRPRTYLTLKKSLLNHCRAMGIDKLNISNDIPKDVTGKKKQFLTNLNYLFTEQVHAASKIIKRLDRKEKIEMRRRKEQMMKIEDIELSTDCSEDEFFEQEDFKTEGPLNTRYVASWLLKNI